MRQLNWRHVEENLVTKYLGTCLSSCHDIIIRVNPCLIHDVRICIQTAVTLYSVKSNDCYLSHAFSTSYIIWPIWADNNGMEGYSMFVRIENLQWCKYNEHIQYLCASTISVHRMNLAMTWLWTTRHTVVCLKWSDFRTILCILLIVIGDMICLCQYNLTLMGKQSVSFGWQGWPKCSPLAIHRNLCHIAGDSLILLVCINANMVQAPLPRVTSNDSFLSHMNDSRDVSLTTNCP